MKYSLHCRAVFRDFDIKHERVSNSKTPQKITIEIIEIYFHIFLIKNSIFLRSFSSYEICGITLPKAKIKLQKVDICGKKNNLTVGWLLSESREITTISKTSAIFVD